MGHISGAALNPAVSVAMGMGGKERGEVEWLGGKWSGWGEFFVLFCLGSLLGFFYYSFFCLEFFTFFFLGGDVVWGELFYFFLRGKWRGKWLGEYMFIFYFFWWGGVFYDMFMFFVWGSCFFLGGRGLCFCRVPFVHVYAIRLGICLGEFFTICLCFFVWGSFYYMFIFFVWGSCFFFWGGTLFGEIVHYIFSFIVWEFFYYIFMFFVWGSCFFWGGTFGGGVGNFLFFLLGLIVFFAFKGCLGGVWLG